MAKKYKLIGQCCSTFSRGKWIDLYKIQALIDIPTIGVSKGDIGGYVESELNLSHEGTCWIDGEAQVYDNAVVCENAHVCDDVIVCSDAKISGNAYVGGNIYVGGTSVICGDTRISDVTRPTICGDAFIRSNDDIFWLRSPLYHTNPRRSYTDTFFRCSDGIVRVYYPTSDLVTDFNRYVEYNSNTGSVDKFNAVVNFVKVAMNLTDNDVK